MEAWEWRRHRWRKGRPLLITPAVRKRIEGLLHRLVDVLARLDRGGLERAVEDTKPSVYCKNTRITPTSTRAAPTLFCPIPDPSPVTLFTSCSLQPVAFRPSVVTSRLSLSPSSTQQPPKQLLHLSLSPSLLERGDASALHRHNQRRRALRQGQPFQRIQQIEVSRRRLRNLAYSRADRQKRGQCGQ